MNVKSSFGLHTHRKSDFTGDRVGEEEPALGKNWFPALRAERKKKSPVQSAGHICPELYAKNWSYKLTGRGPISDFRRQRPWNSKRGKSSIAGDIVWEKGQGSVVEQEEEVAHGFESFPEQNQVRSELAMTAR
jgi:hypothetical protein